MTPRYNIEPSPTNIITNKCHNQQTKPYQPNLSTINMDFFGIFLFLKLQMFKISQNGGKVAYRHPR
jgi:hypothetical protein